MKIMRRLSLTIKNLKQTEIRKTEVDFMTIKIKSCCLDLNSVQTLFKLGYGKFPEYMI